ncbi:MAG: hypothetical protein NC131_21605 [Roseburia sp.]|nr:hypothetical protein [Roseburia sp.]
MAVKPTIHKIGTFDANDEFVFQFAYQGSQPYTNELMIYDAESGHLVYDRTVETMKMSHILPAKSLVNNKTYYAEICLYDINGAVSELSDKIYFSCYTTPNISILNLSSDGSAKVTASGYDIQVSYSQEENRSLKEYIFRLYDSTGYNLLYESGTRYYSNDSGGIITCPVRGLENDMIYYFSFSGITVDNVKFNTPLIPFYAKYRKSLSYSVLNVECDKNAGYMKYNTYLVIVEGKSSGTYTLDNGILNISRGKVFYDSGFNISGDFIIGIKYRAGTTITLSSGTDNITLYSGSYENKDYYKLEVSNSGLPPTVIYSRLYDQTEEMRTIYIKRVDGIYGLTAAEQTNDLAVKGGA